jgi:hypothetical protein
LPRVVIVAPEEREIYGRLEAVGHDKVGEAEIDLAVVCSLVKQDVRHCAPTFVWPASLTRTGPDTGTGEPLDVPVATIVPVSPIRTTNAPSTFTFAAVGVIVCGAVVATVPASQPGALPPLNV